MTAKLHTIAFVAKNLYKDSVALMRVAQGLLAMPGVHTATLQMGNPANKDILAEAGLLSDAVASAGPSDIMIVIQSRDTRQGQDALRACEAALAGQNQDAGASQNHDARAPAKNLGLGVSRLRDAGEQINLAQISVPGPYAASEALKAVKQGLDVFMFSDNVPLAQEVAIKREASRRGVLVMGPDCGTAIINGVPLGFANVVRRGSIGLVAASGTGLQEVTTQIDRLGQAWGVGVSHAIGTGGRDVYAEVGGLSMLHGIALLAKDAQTKVIAIVSKPPAPAVVEKVMAALAATGKPSVVVFLGASPRTNARRIHVAATLVDGAAMAVKLAVASSARTRRGAGAPAASAQKAAPYYPLPHKPVFARSQRFLRALYSGGTYAAEAQHIWAEQFNLKVWSNVAIDNAMDLPTARRGSRDHTALDLGDDAFTVGRPHPMIDQAARIERLMQEAKDPAVRVILLDVVIGWGAHADPAGELGAAIEKAIALAKRARRHLAVIGFVCGTEQDPQVLSRQESRLRAAGMVLAPNSASAAWLAAKWLG